MNRYRICVYAICKNEEKFINRWMDSMQQADLIVVLDTGSDDASVEKLQSRGAKVYQQVIDPFRFDTARNLSLQHVPEDIDICVCTDLDEVMCPNWRELLEAAWQPDTTRATYWFTWSYKPDGQPGMQYHHSKIHSRNAYAWSCPAHEYIRYIGQGQEKVIFIPAFEIYHYPDPGKSRSSYLSMLEMGVQEDPHNDRMAYYLGREYAYTRQWNKCIQTLKKHLQLATWEDERSASMRWIAQSHYELGQLKQAYCWYHRAIAEKPAQRDGYVEFAQMAYSLKDWPTVFYMSHQALQIADKSSTYINMAYAWDETPDDLCAIACYYLGMYERARIHAADALAFSPQDKRLQENLAIIERRIQPEA